MDVTPERFEELVADALDRIPDQLMRLMRNVSFLIEDEHPEDDLLGLYHGVPLTKRRADHSGYLPDTITIYRLPHLRNCSDEQELAAEVAETVEHEIAHFFGIDHERLHELGHG